MIDLFPEKAKELENKLFSVVKPFPEKEADLRELNDAEEFLKKRLKALGYMD